MNGVLLALLGYLAAQLALGMWVSRGIRTEADYLIGGRRLGYPLTIASIFATWFGAETCIASAGRAYRQGVALTTAEPFGYGLCLFIMGLVFAVPLWRRKLTTLADLFRTRFSPTVERTAAVILIPSSILWAAAQMRGFGHVLTTATPVSLDTAVLVAAGFCVLYTAWGGLLADAVTDLVQGIVLTLGLLVVLAGVIVARGGVGPAVAVAAAPGKLALAAVGADTSPLAILEEWAIPVAGSVLATELVSRVIAARTPAIARNSSLLAGALYVGVGLIPVVVGLAATGLVPPLADAEELLPSVARHVLPTALYVVFAGGLISAILSTIDTTLLVSSGLLSHNLLAPALGISDDRRRLQMARWGVIGFGIAAYVLAVRAEGVFALVEQASAFGSAGALVTVTFGLFSPWGGPRTALATLVGAMIAYLVATVGGAPYPFLASLATALVIYAGGALVEHGAPAAGAAATTEG